MLYSPSYYVVCSVLSCASVVLLLCMLSIFVVFRCSSACLISLCFPVCYGYHAYSYYMFLMMVLLRCRVRCRMCFMLLIMVVRNRIVVWCALIFVVVLSCYYCYVEVA